MHKARRLHLRVNSLAIYSKVRMAEEEGFEPPCEFPRKRFSRPPVSTTHPFLRLLSYLIPSCYGCVTMPLLGHVCSALPRDFPRSLSPDRRRGYPILLYACHAPDALPVGSAR